MALLLEVAGLTKRYGGVVANSAVSLGVRAGEIVGVMGPNGAGKTTLFDLISGFTRPDAGRIVFDDSDITGERPHAVSARGLGRTFQRLRPFPDLTFVENVLEVTVSTEPDALEIPPPRYTADVSRNAPRRSFGCGLDRMLGSLVSLIAHASPALNHALSMGRSPSRASVRSSS